MTYPTYKLAPQVSVYRLGGEIYFHRYDEICRLDDMGDTAGFDQFLTQLEKGVTVDLDSTWAPLVEALDQQGFLATSPEGQSFTTPQVRPLAVDFGSSPDHPFWPEVNRHLTTYGWKAASPGGTDGDVAVILRREGEDEAPIMAENRHRYEGDQPFLIVDLSLIRYGLVGPLVQPPNLGCYRCLVERRLINGDEITDHQLKNRQPLKGGTGEVPTWALSWTAALVTAELTAAPLPSLRSHQVIHIDFHRREMWREGLLVYPHCPVCRPRRDKPPFPVTKGEL